jgi:translation initiation factor 4E
MHLNDIQKMHLNDSWCIYFHDPFDKNWDETSYVKLGTMSTIYDAFNMLMSLHDYSDKGMFFIMREHIFPEWNNENNRNGGAFSLKVLKENINNFFEDVVLKLFGETLLKDSKQHLWEFINGISISPKKNFCIIKIWIKQHEIINQNDIDICKNLYNGTIMYSKHA